MDYPTIVEHESYIVWLRNPELYDYLREGVMDCHHRTVFPLRKYDPSKRTDGGKGAHIVAYVELSPEAEAEWPMGFQRRYWWVKEYDRFIGSAGGHYNLDPNDAPCEAVDIDTIVAGMQSEGFDPDEMLFCRIKHDLWPSAELISGVKRAYPVKV